MSGLVTFEDLVNRLKKALGKDGDFPASAKVVSELHRLARDPKSTAQQMTDVILKEPSLGTKILGVVNSAYFRRVKPILTVSEAVVALGSRQIADICSSLLILNKFSSGPSDNNLNKALQKGILNGLISSGLKTDSNSEIGFMAGVFRNLGEVLLFFYYPDIGKKLKAVAESKNVLFEDAFRLVFQRELLEIVVLVFEEINLPRFYQDCLKAAILLNNPRTTISVNEKLLEQAIVLEIGHDVAKNITEGEPIDYRELTAKYPGFSESQIQKSVELGLESIEKFEEFTNIDFSQIKINKGLYIQDQQASFSKNDQLLEPIKQAISRSANTATLLIMSTEILKSSFHRVILYLKSKDEPIMKVRIFEGNRDGFKEVDMAVDLGRDHVLIDSLKVGKPVFPTTGLFTDSFPVVCIPVGNIRTPVAVIYADRRETVDGCLEISDRERDLIMRLHALINSSLKRISASARN